LIVHEILSRKVPKPRESCRDKFKELQILTVPSLHMFEVFLYVKQQNLIQAHNHSYNITNRNVNLSMQHNLRLYETKPCYVGRTFFAQLRTSLTEIQNFNTFLNNLKQYLIDKCYYDLPGHL
jgi:hypothetical protein